MQQRATAEKTLNLRFEVFGWRALGERARAARKPVEEILEQACELFVARLESDRRPPPAPRFKPSSGTGQDMTLAVPDRVWESIAEESMRSGISLEQLVEHAAFVYLNATEEPGIESPPAEG